MKTKQDSVNYRHVWRTNVKPTGTVSFAGGGEWWEGTVVVVVGGGGGIL